MGRPAVEPILQDDDKKRNKNGYSCCVIPILVASFLFLNRNDESVTSALLLPVCQWSCVSVVLCVGVLLCHFLSSIQDFKLSEPIPSPKNMV
mmetsp:Transcript_73357/g.107717  ORF Transcript_73357/g.107717 Transcript_73357/m.107717 type:complete len:92 (-) Transcript_73357:113-388(-)